MYKKRKNATKSAVDEKLAEISTDMLTVNPDTVFALAKKFLLNEQNELAEELKGDPIIFSNTRIEDLIIPSPYRLIGKNKIAYWYEDDILATIMYINMKFYDGKKVKNLYLDMNAKKLDEYKSYHK